MSNTLSLTFTVIHSHTVTVLSKCKSNC